MTATTPHVNGNGRHSLDEKPGFCDGCESTGIGCWQVSDGAWQCKGTKPASADAWIFITRLDNGFRVYNRKARVMNADDLREWQPDDGQADQMQEHGSRLVTVSLADVAREAVSWFWYRRVANRSVTIIGGPVGLGKTMIGLSVVGIATGGGRWPLDTDQYAPKPTNVILVVAEDDVATTIRPRIEAAGGDPNRVTIVKGTALADGTEQLFSTKLDTDALGELAKEKQAGLILIDPVSLFVGGRTDQNAHGDVYSALAPLAKLAQTHDLAIILIHHWRKGGGENGRAVERLMGSQAWGAIARNVWTVREDPDDPDKRLRIMAHAKASLCKLQPALRFTISENESGDPFVHWEDVMDETADQIEERAEGARRKGEPTDLDDAVDWLRANLTTTPVSSGELTGKAKAEGINESTLKKARIKLGVKSQPQRDGNGRVKDWLVWLPVEVSQ